MEDFDVKVAVEDLCCKQSVDESKHLPETSSKAAAKKRGRKAYLTPEQRRENKRESDRKYRRNKAAEMRALEENYQNLKEHCGKLKVGLSEATDQSPIVARADKLVVGVSGVSKIVNDAKMAKKGVDSMVEDLEQHILNPKDSLEDIQMDQVWDSLEDIPMDREWLFSKDNVASITNMGEIFTGIEGSLSGEGPETVDFKGFRILKDNAPAMHEIFNKHPNIASGLQFEHETFRSCCMNMLADIYNKAMMEVDKPTLEEIKHMKAGIKDLERAGLDVSWLSALTVVCRKRSKRSEKVKNTNDELEIVDERQTKRKNKTRTM